MESIAIIGAGLAGLSAARQLQVKGHHTQIFEKGKVAGGRLSTQQEDWGEFDQGAQYFTARHPEFIEQLGLWQHQGIVTQWKMQPARWQHGELSLSADSQQRWIGTPSMSILATNLAKDLNILYNCRVINMEFDHKQCWLFDMKGRHFGPFDAVIIATPVANTLALIPQDSPVYSSVQQVEMSPCWSLSCRFDETFAPDWVQGIFCEHPILRWISRNTSKPSRSSSQEIWVLHSQEHWAQMHLGISKNQLTDYMLLAFKEILGQDIPAVQAAHCHLWTQARNHRKHLNAQKAFNIHTLIDRQRKLAICGDWLTGGRVEGAYLSGLKTAETIANSLSKAHASIS